MAVSRKPARKSVKKASVSKKSFKSFVKPKPVKTVSAAKSRQKGSPAKSSVNENLNQLINTFNELLNDAKPVIKEFLKSLSTRGRDNEVKSAEFTAEQNADEKNKEFSDPKEF